MQKEHPSKRQVRNAGEDLAAGLLSGEDRAKALRTVGYWRAAHIEPLRKTLFALEDICGQDESTILVSRLKRIDTMVNKLNRTNHEYNLTNLRDIAGCRLIVQNNEDVSKMVKKIKSHMQCYKVIDHMSCPKQSGYRGIHIICRHNSESYGYENLNVEIQVRSRIQHDWATAVETYDMITETGLKFDHGSEKQKRYFQLASALINNDVDDEPAARLELKELDDELQVLSKLREATDSMYDAYDAGLEISRTNSCLITVDMGMQQINIEVYRNEDEDKAADKYTELESNEEAGLIYLLARAGSLEDLKKAYPNYYSGISGFVERMEEYIK